MEDEPNPARRIADLIGAPTVFVTLVDDDAARRCPASESFCRAALAPAGGQVSDDTAIVVVRSPQIYSIPEPA